MFPSLRHLALACTALSSVALSARIPHPHSLHSKRQDTCAAENTTVVLVQQQITEYTIEINQYYSETTVLVINDGLTLNVSYAPTQYSTLVTALTTVEVTLSADPTAYVSTEDCI